MTTTPSVVSMPMSTEPKVSEGTKIKSFFEHVGEWLKVHLGTTASFEHTAATALKIAEPLINTLLALTAGEPIAAKVSAVANQVINDLNTTSAILNGAAATGGITVTSLLTGVQSNLSTLLADADVKNSAKSAEITGIVNSLLGEVEAILSAAAPAPAAG